MEAGAEKDKEQEEMKLRKNFENRLKKADFYQLFVVDSKGVGYASQSSKKGISRTGVLALIARMEKEKEYLVSLLEEKKFTGDAQVERLLAGKEVKLRIIRKDFDWVHLKNIDGFQEKEGELGALESKDFTKENGFTGREAISVLGFGSGTSWGTKRYKIGRSYTAQKGRKALWYCPKCKSSKRLHSAGYFFGEQPSWCVDHHIDGKPLRFVVKAITATQTEWVLKVKLEETK